MICTFQDRDRKENGRYAPDHIELTSTGDHHRSQRMNNGSLISGGSDGSTGQSSSRMSQQTDSSGGFY